MFNANHCLKNESLCFNELLQKRDALVRTITSYMIANSVTGKDMAVLLGMSQPKFSSKMSYRISFTDNDLDKLLEVLECDLPELKEALLEHRVLGLIKRELVK